MKKIIYLTIVAIGLLPLSACIKNPLLNLGTGTVGSGTWTYAGVKDTATSCVYSPGTGNEGMSGSNYSNSFANYTTIRCGFLDTLFAGTYTIVPTTTNIGPHQMSFEIDYGLSGSNGNSWYSTGLGGQTVNVSISGNKVTITGANISIYQIPLTGNPNASDTSTLSLNLTAYY